MDIQLRKIPKKIHEIQYYPGNPLDWMDFFQSTESKFAPTPILPQFFQSMKSNHGYGFESRIQIHEIHGWIG